jgi:hypothetical protein
MKGFTFGIGNRLGWEDKSKLYMPGPGFYYTKENSTTFSPKMPVFSIPTAGSNFGL